VTEGEDKPLKYPKMFRNAKHVVMTKTDLLPHVPFDMDRAVANALSINPALGVFRVSATSGEGMEEWFDFLRTSARRVVAP
jgi:hydrogenase nickel incorporation protein HypB